MTSNTFSRFVSRRLPEFRLILPVYAVTAFMVYGWTLLTYFRYLHYWLTFLNISEILAIFCYAMLADLAESIFIISILLAVTMILPPKVLRDMFVVRGTLLMICTLGSILFFLNYYPDLNAYMFSVLPWAVGTVLAAILVAFFVARLRFVVQAITWLSDSMIIFLYIFWPVTVMSLLVVLARNLA